MDYVDRRRAHYFAIRDLLRHWEEVLENPSHEDYIMARPVVESLRKKWAVEQEWMRIWVSGMWK